MSVVTEHQIQPETCVMEIGASAIAVVELLPRRHLRNASREYARAEARAKEAGFSSYWEMRKARGWVGARERRQSEGAA